MHIICAFNPQAKQWQYAELFGLAFGVPAAVIQFNRVPAMIIAISRRWLGIPAINFFDDVHIQAPAGNDTIAWSSFNWLVEKLGWLFDIDKDSPMAKESWAFSGYDY